MHPTATIRIEGEAELRSYRLRTTAELRDGKPAGGEISFKEDAGHATIRTGDLLFDGLYALAISEAQANSVSQISDYAYGKGSPVTIDVFQTGEYWKYVWTRDLSYSLHLGLANFDPQRAVHSLLFKSSVLKESVKGGLGSQIVQDTGSGGSYPISTDRVVWALGADETLKNLSPSDQQSFLEKVFPILRDTAEQDRRLIFDPKDGLYRGEQSFLDWREQTYPEWTKSNVLSIGMSKALSTNALHYSFLQRLANYSGLHRESELQARYAGWAKDLKTAINRHFYDEKIGLYSAYLLTDGGEHFAPVGRYDLLGESLAILLGIADSEQALSVISNYPVGPFGPAVVWPQERAVSIYHNQAIWPFVTAYWLKASGMAGHSGAVEAGINSLQDLAATNLSNMENYDFLSGKAEVKTGARKGPEVNSRRQLWSVAGYLSMVQDVIFGFENAYEGIRFHPCIPAKVRDAKFAESESIELRNFTIRGTRHTVRLYLPAVGAAKDGILGSERAELNGRPVGNGFVQVRSFKPDNLWEIYLKGEREVRPTSLLVVQPSNERAVFAPFSPRWDERKPIVATDGRLVLHYAHDESANVSFNIYRDGQLTAGGIHDTSWTDPDSADFRDVVRTYAIEAVDLQSGNVSHRTTGQSYRTPEQRQIISGSDLQNRGGSRDAQQKITDWGYPGDEITSDSVKVQRTGEYGIRAEFANGAGPVSTGITCGVKKLEMSKGSSKGVVASGYLIMPQSGDWKRYDLSSAVLARLNAGETYTLRISEDEYCRNMSYLGNNERYTSAAGGGPQSYNMVNLAAIHLSLIAVG